MKPLYRNLFLLFGLCAIAFMVYSFPEGWETIKRNPTNVLLYLPGVVGIWLFVYLCNAWAFQIFGQHLRPRQAPLVSPTP